MLMLLCGRPNKVLKRQENLKMLNEWTGFKIDKRHIWETNCDNWKQKIPQDHKSFHPLVLKYTGK